MTAWPYPRAAAHRGAGKLAPENTLAAMRVGLRARLPHGRVRREALGRRCAVPAARRHARSHDRRPRARRCARPGRSSPSSTPEAGTRRRTRANRLPTLAAIAHWAIANGVACNVEIKPMPGRERETGAAVALDARALWRDAATSAAAVVVLRGIAHGGARRCARTPRALLLEEIPPDWEARLARLECVAIDANFRALNEPLVAAAHRAGYKVLTYTPNELASHRIDFRVGRRSRHHRRHRSRRALTTPSPSRALPPCPIRP